MLIFVGLVLGALTSVYFYLTRNHDYWKKRGVPYIPALPIFGSLKPLVMLQESPGSFMGNLYRDPQVLQERFAGFFLFNSEPAILLRDPELIKQVFVKDFAHFSNRNVECDAENDPIGHNNLFVLRDEKWKYLRSKLTPIFTSGRLKEMFNIILGIGNEFLINIDNQLKDNKPIVEIKELAARYTTDVITSCAFGIQSNSLNDPNSIFRHFGKMIFNTSIWRALEIRSTFFMHWFGRVFKVVLFSKGSSQFFRSVFWEALEMREKSGNTRNDFLDTLIKLKKDAAKKLEDSPDRKDLFEFSGDSLVAQSVLFFSAGFETTSSTISNTLTELSLAPDVQEKLRNELNENIESHGGQVTYEGIFEMKYLNKVVSEVLRKYPPMPFVDRLCTKDWKIPGSEVVIKKGTPVFLSLYNGIHYDPEYFPDPDKFDPERFSEENKADRHPFCYIPFGEGPHVCIGLRFGMMNIKTAIVLLLRKYKVEPTPEIKMPLKMDPRGFLLNVQSKLPLKFTPI